MPVALAATARRLGRITAGAACGSALLIAVGVCGHLAVLRLTGNFHTVVPGQLYRSGQPTAGAIADYTRSYGIRTIVNLRGANAGKGWYDAEVAAARRLGVALVDFPMSARRPLSRQQAVDLLGILGTARKPVLIHCGTGADRSGLAAALYLAGIDRIGESEAGRQMSIRYGHIALPGTKHAVMDESFERLGPQLGLPDT